MKAEYDFSKMKSRKNPYASKLKKSVTMRLSEDVVEYFKGMAEEARVPYQSLINLYLRDCLAQNRRVFSVASTATSTATERFSSTGSRITTASKADSDARPLTPKQLQAMVPMKAVRGRPKSANKKLLVSMRCSPRRSSRISSQPARVGSRGWTACFNSTSLVIRAAREAELCVSPRKARWCASEMPAAVSRPW